MCCFPATNIFGQQIIIGTQDITKERILSDRKKTSKLITNLTVMPCKKDWNISVMEKVEQVKYFFNKLPSFDVVVEYIKLVHSTQGYGKNQCSKMV